ncbi:MAG TPA: hypothetical protein VGO02_00155, partial [Burkholderiales bacterium]|nr:hypothetical protein [Burkholderiales bacterium]
MFKPADARRLAEEILNLTGADEEAESTLEQILTQTKAWPELAKLLHGRARRVSDSAERVRLLFKIAQLEEEKVGDLAATAQTLEAVVDLEPSNDRALRSLIRVLEARQDWPALAAALRRDFGLRATQPDREEVALRIGQLQETRIGDAGAAFTTYSEVLQANPLSAAAVTGLERLGAAGHPNKIEIARLSLPYYQRTDNAAKLAGAFEALTGDPAATPEDRLQQLQKLRTLYAGPLKDPKAAYGAALRIFAEVDPADVENRELLIHFAAETQVVAELADRMRVVANATDDQKLRRDLLVEIAQLHEQRLGRAQDAEKVYAEILQVEPLHAGAARALGRLYRDSERWTELRALLEGRQALVTEPRERLDLLAQIAEIDEAVLDDVDHAVGSYEQMLQLNPADLRAHRALDRHYATQERWKDLEALLGTRVTFASAPEIPELEFRRAEIRVARFDDVEGALHLLETIVRAAPSHEGARRLLERILALPNHRQRASKILEPLYESSGAWSRLVAVLELQREGKQGKAAAALLARIADLQENKLQARTAALASWRQVLTEDPTNPDALTEVERLATALERFSELVDVYQELAFSRDTADI